MTQEQTNEDKSRPKQIAFEPDAGQREFAEELVAKSQTRTSLSDIYRELFRLGIEVKMKDIN